MSKTQNKAKEIQQDSIDKQNRAFWDELCGSALARSLGITDHSLDSLQKFDQAYLNIYPYLPKYFADLGDKKVLEIGLGYGTLAQNLAAECGKYYGLDISLGPAKIVNQRMKLYNLNGVAFPGSELAIPYKDNFFDVVVSIGCLHHTGNIQKAIDEIYRVLRPNGRAIIMVYNKFSLRQWCKQPIGLLKEMFFGNRSGNQDVSVRFQYDTNAQGEAAPFT